MTSVYRAQVELLLQVLPHVAAETCFALKGGTALNLFVRDMPRLSVDLDLTYLPVEPRGVDGRYCCRARTCRSFRRACVA